MVPASETFGVDVLAQPVRSNNASSRKRLPAMIRINVMSANFLRAD